MKDYKSSLALLGLFIFIIMFLELTFKARLLYFEFQPSHILNLDFFRNLLFTLSYGLFVLAFIKLFKPKGVRRLLVIFNLLLIGLYFSQDIYYLISANFYSVAISGEVAKGLTFFYRLPQSLMWTHLFYLVPILLTFYLLKLEKQGKIKLVDVRYQSVRQPFIFTILAVSSLFIAIQTINTNKSADDLYSFSDYDLYIEPIVPHTAMRKFGVFTYARIDFQNALRPHRVEDITDEHVEDFFEHNLGHEINEMTGVFEGKNLIMIMAEAFDTYAIHPELMPTLDRMLDNAWYFENFYAPLYYRNTADTEFMVQTGYYPNKTLQLSMTAYEDNYFPNTFPRLFGELDYTSLAFHNFSDHFYPREDFHPNTIGFNEYYGYERLGFVTPLDDEREARGHYWHSDLEMMERGLPYVLAEEQFFAYFLTVTGHLPYEGGRHDIALENYPIINDILIDIGLEDIDETLKYYHASQWELDLALEYLLDELERTNQLDDTIIVIYGDHYAYGLDRDVIWEYDTMKDETNLLNIHNVPFLIYNPSLESQTFDHYFSTIDLLPTLSNMFGLDLDYEYMMGNDAFNSRMNTIIFSSVSFLTESYYYDIEREMFEHIDGELSPEQIRAYVGEVIYRTRLNNYILDNDYFARYRPANSQRYDDSLPIAIE